MAEAIPEVESCRHGCCHPNECRIGNYVTPTVTDDTASVSSAEIVGDGCVDAAQNPQIGEIDDQQIKVYPWTEVLKQL
ncbi:hypothetical protein N7540_012394 [Penicillium herquei]|nr:hypothetical protein N7540_012394 [Penicillium herquei]